MLFDYDVQLRVVKKVESSIRDNKSNSRDFAVHKHLQAMRVQRKSGAFIRVDGEMCWHLQFARMGFKCWIFVKESPWHCTVVGSLLENQKNEIQWVRP